jgi:hypothetical protein
MRFFILLPFPAWNLLEAEESEWVWGVRAITIIVLIRIFVLLGDKYVLPKALAKGCGWKQTHQFPGERFCPIA